MGLQRRLRWKPRAGMLTLSALTLGLAMVGLAGPAGAASNNANLCKNGGWRTVVKADATRFKNQGDCVSYAVRGGTPTLKMTAQLACESQGGTYKIIGPQPTHVRCTGTTIPEACAGYPPITSGCVDALSVRFVQVREAAISLDVAIYLFDPLGLRQWELGP